MKKYLITLLLTLFSSSIFAANPACVKIYTFSGSLMTDVQYEHPIHTKEWYVRSVGEYSNDPIVTGILVGIIETAFEIPSFFREEQKKEAIAFFAERMYIDCQELFKPTN